MILKNLTNKDRTKLSYSENVYLPKTIHSEKTKQGCYPLSLLPSITVLMILAKILTQEKERRGRQTDWKGKNKAISIHSQYKVRCKIKENPQQVCTFGPKGHLPLITKELTPRKCEALDLKEKITRTSSGEDSEDGRTPMWVCLTPSNCTLFTKG